MKKKNAIVRGYKAFVEGLICRGFKYEIGKDYKTDEKIELCKSGFHFCRSLGDVYSFYPFGSVVAEVESFGDVIHDETDGKSVTNGIRIIRILDAEKEARGNKNNTSTGYLNTGDWNTGNWNTGNRNTGFFNTVTPEDILIFNKPCKRDIWDNANKPNLIYFDLIKWIEFSDMTDKEKENYPSAKHLGGYLKGLDYKEAWKDAWDKASKSDRKLLTQLPNFDWSVFTEISGIKKEDYEN